jgi:4-aminobutyrate aminotransferase-like enzyme
MSITNDNHQQNELLETRSPGFTIDQTKDIVNNLYGLTGKLFPLDSERDQNFSMVADSGDQFVVRIANSAENPAVIDMQIKAMEHIANMDPELPVPKVLLSHHGQALEHIQADNGTKHILHILTYIPGSHPQDRPTNHDLLRPIGTCLARLALALRGFFHPAANYELLWDLKHAAMLNQYLPHIPDSTHRELASYFLDRFANNALPVIPKLRMQIIHNDLVPDNVLVAEDDPGRIVGIIDFGDMLHSLIVTDLATTIAPMIRGHADPVGAAVEIVAAYHETSPLEPVELGLLYDLTAARLTMLNVIAYWRAAIHPENVEYITGGVEHVWDTLKMWRAENPAEVTKRFFRACGLWEKEDNLEPGNSNETLQSHLLRRTRLLGPCYYLFYDRPLSIVRSEGVWLYDPEGTRYLDAYNNVAHVGHCHPHVLNAITRQGQRLNISTRYMHGLILELAEQITARMPESLSVCMFVCTGSEANELAWRMSKLISGNSGALITKYSYHGNGDATTKLSTETIPQESLPSYIQTINAPTSNTSFREPDSGMESAIRIMNEQGHRPAMLILDSGFTSDGIYTAPKGYLRSLYAKTRAAGGLCVADEVQAGFGRLGQHFWGFDFDDVVPDIVTMGKSMGNGHPIAAVVTRPEIAEALERDTGYFNTYGGNPVSCAAGLAVLNVIEKEGLQHNALEIGQYIRDGLLAIQKDYSAIGVPHGSGLLLGVDIVKPDNSPDPVRANRIMNHMRENGVLIGTTGKNANTLKIRPPIVFQKEHVDILLAALTKALRLTSDFVASKGE